MDLKQVLLRIYPNSTEIYRADQLLVLDEILACFMDDGREESLPQFLQLGLGLEFGLVRVRHLLFLVVGFDSNLL